MPVRDRFEPIMMNAMLRRQQTHDLKLCLPVGAVTARGQNHGLARFVFVGQSGFMAQRASTGGRRGFAIANFAGHGLRFLEMGEDVARLLGPLV